ncbi:MAG: cytochrome-c peroxidase [Salibacteraceae bacterium]
MLLFNACNKADEQKVQPQLIDNGGITVYPLRTPSYFPNYTIPSENELTQAKVDLGEMLFNDVVFSIDSSISCATCHLKSRALTDGLAVSVGVNGRKGTRSAPSLLNVLWAPYFMWDGGPNTLEKQVVLPFDNHDEFDLNIVEAANRLNQNLDYVNKFDSAFGSLPNPRLIAEALACFERTLVSEESRFDKYFYLKDSSILSQSELSGMQLFFSKELACSECHTPPLFTTYEFINNGLFEFGKDPGRFKVTDHKPDEGKFKVPTLRNIKITAPYMHDGRFKTLEEVIDHYASGGNSSRTQDSRIKKQNLTIQQKADLVAFLNSLTDSNFEK